jgi:hypothetical protein
MKLKKPLYYFKVVFVKGFHSFFSAAVFSEFSSVGLFQLA